MTTVRESAWLRPALVVGLVSLLAASGPLLLGGRGDPAWALEVAVLRVDEAVSKARQLAVSSGRAHAVVFDAERERFGIVDMDGVLARDSDTGDAALVELSEVPGGERIDLVDAVFGSAEPRAMVSADGELVLGGRVLLRCGELEREVVLAASGELGGPDVPADAPADATADAPDGTPADGPADALGDALGDAPEAAAGG